MAERITEDRLFEALANVHRRRLLFALVDDESQDVSELAGVPWSLSESEETMVNKRHVHLPKLADYGFIEWDRNDQLVSRGPQFDEIEPILECLGENRDQLALALV